MPKSPLHPRKMAGLAAQPARTHVLQALEGEAHGVVLPHLRKRTLTCA